MWGNCSRLGSWPQPRKPWKRGFHPLIAVVSSDRSTKHVGVLPPIFPLLHPISFSVHSLWPCHDFGLSVSLGVGRSGILVGDPKLIVILPEVLAIKLKTVVWDECVWSSEACNNNFPNEFLGVHIPDVGQRFSLYPFGEIIGSNDYISLISCSFGERTDNIKTPLSKRPKAGEWVKDSSWLMDIWGESLALITLLCIFLGFSLHVRPPVPLGERSMRQGSPPGMTSTNPLM